MEELPESLSHALLQHRFQYTASSDEILPGDYNPKQNEALPPERPCLVDYVGLDMDTTSCSARHIPYRMDANKMLGCLVPSKAYQDLKHSASVFRLRSG